MIDFKKLFPFRLGRQSGESVVAVVGSDGKSTTVALLALVLGTKYEVVQTVSEQPDLKEVTKTLGRVKRDGKAVVEIDPRQLDEFSEYAKIVKPGVLVVTTTEYPQHHFQGDSTAFVEGLKRFIQIHPKMVLVFNWDDPNLRALGEGLGESVIFYGSNPRECHIWASNFKIDNLRTRYELNYGVERVEIVSPLLGFQLISAQLAAAAVAINWEIPLTTVKKAIEGFEGLDSHMEPFQGFNGSIVIDDTTKLSPQSMMFAIDTLNDISAKKRIVILSGLTDLGSVQERVNKEIGFKLFRDRTDYIYLIGEESEPLKDELIKLGYAPDRIEYNQTNNQIIGKLLKTLSKGDLVLLKTAKQARISDLLARLTKLR